MTAKLTMPSLPDDFSLQLRKDYTLIFQSGLFDEKDYLARYPDVLASKYTALEHYLRFGDKSDREPFIGYSPSYYRNYFPKIRHKDINSLVHYIQHGRALKAPTQPIIEAKERSKFLILYIDDYDIQHFLPEILLFIDTLVNRTLFDIKILLKSISEKTLPFHERLSCYCLGDSIDSDYQFLKNFWPRDVYSLILFSSTGLKAMHEARIFDYVPAIKVIICSNSSNIHLIEERRTEDGHHYKIIDRRYMPYLIQNNLRFYSGLRDRPRHKWQLIENISSLLPIDLSMIYIIHFSTDISRLISSLNSVLEQTIATIEIIFVFSKSTQDHQIALRNYYELIPDHTSFYSSSMSNDLEILEAIEASHGKRICFSSGKEVYEQAYFESLISATLGSLAHIAHGDFGIKKLNYVDQSSSHHDGCFFPSEFSETLSQLLFIGGIVFESSGIKSYFLGRQFFFGEEVEFLKSTLYESTYFYNRAISFSRNDSESEGCSEVLDSFFEEFDAYKENHFGGLRIGIYVHGLLFSKGGIENVAVNIANELVIRGHQVTLYCRNAKQKKSLYPILNSIEIVDCWDMKDFDQSRIDLQQSLLEKKIEIFIPMLSEYLFTPIIDAAFEVGVPIIASEHNDPEVIVKQWWDKYDRINSFRKVDQIHLLLDKFTHSLPEDLRDKSSVIPNFVDNVKIVKIPEKVQDILFVGRLAEQKGIERLIKAFHQLSDCNNSWTLSIIGEGALHDELEDLISQLNLSDKVMLKGVSNSVMEEYLRSSIFVLPSYFEGFGIVVLEAQQASLPCIAFESCNGPNELIKNGVNGFLVDDSDRGQVERNLADKLRTLMLDKSLRIEMGEKGRLHAQDFLKVKVVDQWEAMIKAVHQNRVA